MVVLQGVFRKNIVSIIIVQVATISVMRILKVIIISYFHGLRVDCELT